MTKISVQSLGSLICTLKGTQLQFHLLGMLRKLASCQLPGSSMRELVQPLAQGSLSDVDHVEDVPL